MRARKSRPFPIIVVISGFTGNSEHNKDVVRRFAQAGFYAIAPELYHREGACREELPGDGADRGKVTRASTSAISALPPTTPSSSRGRRRPIGRDGLLRRGR